MITYEIYAKLRNSKKMRDADVAKIASIPPSTFSDWKRGKSKPKEDKIEKIRIALGFTPDEWFRIQTSDEPDNVLDSLYPVEVIYSMLGVNAQDVQLAKEISMLDEEGKKMIALVLSFYKQKNEQ